MAFASNISINDNAAASKTFKQISSEPTGTVRMDDSTTNVAPRQMVIRHTKSTPKGSTVVTDRHLLQFSTTKVDTENEAQTAIVNLTISIPRSPAVVQADVDHLLAFVKNWIATGANVTGLVLGES
jgi:hypothetical protein